MRPKRHEIVNLQNSSGDSRGRGKTDTLGAIWRSTRTEEVRDVPQVPVIIQRSSIAQGGGMISCEAARHQKE
jgi:hypothetical protein